MTNQKRGAAKLFYAAKEKREQAAGVKAKQTSGAQPGRRPGRATEEEGAREKRAGGKRQDEQRAAAPAELKPRPKGPPGKRGIDQCAAAFQALRTAALAYPGTFEDHPWGHTLIKLKNKKVILFLGDDAGGLSVTCKLPETGEAALSLLPFASPTGYGLGKSGWVTAQFEAGAQVPLPVLLEWLAESHAAVAPAGRGRG